MDDTIDLPPPPEGVLPRTVEDEMRQSYLDYAMSVIIARALPDARDGLKPANRRLIYAMDQMNLAPGGATVKCAKIVGETMGNYHPHGDEAIYPTLVRMAQDFSLRYPLVKGQGNFGSIDGDPPAAMRYTEAKLSEFSVPVLEDLDKDTVDYVDNFDQTKKEPTVLPGKFPNLLANGGSGIAVGMATNIPPHNLREICGAINYLIDNPSCEISDLMNFVKGPDFPTGAFVLGTRGIVDAYTTGRGSITMQGNYSIEPIEGGKHAILITEVPYQVEPSRLATHIAEMVKDKRLDGIADIREETDRNGIRLVVECKRDAQPRKILNYILKHSSLRTNFGVRMLALVNGRPKLLNLKEALEVFVEHRRVVVTRRTKFELKQAKDRAHILEALKVALDHIDLVIALIRASKNVEEARRALMTHEKLSFTERQANAILEMQLRRLTNLERKAIEDELRETIQLIAKLEDILASPRKVLDIIKHETKQISDKLGDERRTRILQSEAEDISEEDIIPEEETIVTITRDGYVKRVKLDTYRTQRRSGRGITAMNVKEEDTVRNLFVATTHHYLLFFSNRGRVYRIKAYEVPERDRYAIGTAIINLISIEPGEKITAVIPLKDTSREGYLTMVTRRGEVKKVHIREFAYFRTTGFKIFDLEVNDELCWVKFTSGSDDIVCVTHHGQSIRFSEDDVRSMGRTAGGVRAVRLKKGDYVVAMDVAKAGWQLLVATNKGFGKRTDLNDYRRQARGGSGILTMNCTEKVGKVVDACVVRPDDKVIFITANGIVMRTKVSEIRQTGRHAQGVRLIKLGEGDTLVNMERVAVEERDQDQPELNV